MIRLSHIKGTRDNGVMRKYIMPLLPVLLMGLSAITSSAIFCYIALLMIPYFMISNPLGMFPVLMVTSLSSEYFSVAEGVGAMRLFSIGVTLGIFLRVFANGSKIETRWLKYAAYILIVTVLSSVINGGISYTSFMFRITLSILIMIACANVRISTEYAEEIVNNIVAAYSIITILVFVNVLINPSITNTRYSVSADINNNRMAMMSVQLGVSLIMSILLVRNSAFKILCFILGLANLYVIFLSGSRTGIIAFVIGVVGTILIKRIVCHERIKGFIPIVIACSIFLILFNYLVDLYPQLAQRFTVENVVNSRGTSRLDAIGAAVKYIIPRHMLLGVGSTNEPYEVSKYIGRVVSSHNLVVSMLTQVGILGFLGYLSMIWSTAGQMLKRLKNEMILIFPLGMLIAAISNGVGEVVYSERFFWGIISFAILLVNSDKHIEPLKEGKT